MNTDIRLSVFFLDHPKTVKLKRRLGLEGVESLIRLWTWAALNRPDGDVGQDSDDIEIAARWDGEPGAFVSALESLKWIDLRDGRYLLHDWQEHNPWAADADERSDEARLSRLFRTNPEKAKELKAQGRTGITHEEYQKFKKVIQKYDRSTTVVRSNNDSTTDRSTPAPAPAPVPAPAPAPAPIKKTVVVEEVATPLARTHAQARATAAAAAAVNCVVVECEHPKAQPAIAEMLGKIRELWNEKCAPFGIAELAETKRWPDSRIKNAIRFWETQIDCDIGKWEQIIDHLLTKPLMIGKTKPKDGFDEPWTMNFDWVIHPENTIKVREYY